MSRTGRIVVLSVLLALSVAGVGWAASRDLRTAHVRAATAPDVATTTALPVATGPRLVFRHTGLDSEYGTVAEVSLDDPGGPREFTGVACDRVDAVAESATCLRTERGVVTRYRSVDLDADWRETSSTAVPGLPSRTRLSEDGSLVATTVFVTGHSYLTTGFATATTVRATGGRSFGNLERFDLRLGGTSVAPRDRNLWGVTFAADDRTFYATLGSGGETWLLRGDLRTRTLEDVAEHVECPSLSPDGRRIAFKQASTRGGRTWWTPAVLDLASGRRTVLAGEARSVDDQLEWLDDDTVLYGVPRDDEPGVSDVWSLDVDSAASPSLLVEQAWSPAVVRAGAPTP